MSARSDTTFVLSDTECGLLSFINVLFSFAGSAGNLFVCFAFLRYRNLRNTTNVFIVSLACADLLVCLLAQPMFVVSLARQYKQQRVDNVFEDVRKRLTWISMLASLGNLLGVTLDRYIAISDPLRYPARVTTSRALGFLLVVWSTAVAFGTTTESHPRIKIIGQICIFTMIVFLIFPLYVHVLCIARKHARVIQTALLHATTFDKNNNLTQLHSSAGTQKADRNSIKTVGIITGIFVFCWFPLLTLPFLYRAKVFDLKLLLHVLQWANTLALCSSTCNPVVYSWRDRRFRKVLSTAYSRWTARRIVTPFENSFGCQRAKTQKSVWISKSNWMSQS